jgi:polyferredoxin
VKARHLVWIRRVSPALFLILFFFLLIEARLPHDIHLTYAPALETAQDLRIERSVTFFFQLDPLVWLSSLVSGRQWITGSLWAIGVLVLTLFLGRVFCGFVCPFGTLHHLTAWFRPSLKGIRMVRANEKRPSQRFKYFLFVAFLLACLLGLNLAGLMDPISFLFRSVALAVLPGIGLGIRGVFDLMAQSDIKALNLLSYGAEVLVSPVFGYDFKSFQTAWFIGLLFLVILFLNRIRPRFWCRTLCPLGALLGICSRFSILVLKKNEEKCTDCNLCTKTCQGAATPVPGQEWEKAECLLCFNCFDSCPEDALTFGFRWSSTVKRGPDMGRRAVLTGLLTGLSLPFLGRLDGQLDKVADARLIRPPGSLAEREFLTLCQRCGLCMKACPTNAINPTLSEAGMSGFWTPHLIMTQGYCDYTCTLCGSVCPTGAIREITAREKIKRPIKIGSAYVDRGRCLPWSGNAPCIVCEEHCPTSPKAIYLRDAEVPGADGRSLKVKLPYVDLKQCVGCGICENKCPVRGKPAIITIAAGESRSMRNRILL